MKIRLRGDISGTRDGQDWPPRGSVIELPDDEAATLCQNGMATPVADGQVEMAVVPDADVEERYVPLTGEAAPVLGRRKART